MTLDQEIEREEMFAAFLEKRRALGVTLDELSKRYGIARGTYQRIVNHEYTLANSTMKKIEYFVETGLPHPIATLDKSHQCYCTKCFEIFEIKDCNQHTGGFHSYICKPCDSERGYRYRHDDKGKERYKRHRARQSRLYKEKGEWYINYETKRKMNRYRKNYGEYADLACARRVSMYSAFKGFIKQQKESRNGKSKESNNNNQKDSKDYNSEEKRKAIYRPGWAKDSRAERRECAGPTVGDNA